ncbi:hypothetical protein QCA50_017626 [Cerrena zonata]|uniref:Uncharacterized protein n=1 Tax=Cerrena zonata TaxID=2478898 RepID=A0AAW0FF78_9APHY
MKELQKYRITQKIKGSDASNDLSISEASEPEMERQSKQQDFSELSEKLVEEATESNSVDTTNYEDAIDNDSIEAEAEEEKMGFGAQKSEAETSNEVPKGEFENIGSPKIVEKSESIENHGVTESPKGTEDSKAAEVFEASPDAIRIPTDKFELPVEDSKIFLENTESHVESNDNNTKEEDTASRVELMEGFESAKPEEKYENLVQEVLKHRNKMMKQTEEQKGSDHSSRDSESANKSRVEEAHSIHESSSIEDLSEKSSNNGQAHEVPTDKTYYESVDTDIRIEEPLENADQPFISYQDTTSVQMLDDVLIRPTNIVEPAEESTPEQLEGPPELNTHEAFDSNSEMIQPTNIVEPEELEEKIFATEIDPESVIFNDSASIIPTSVVEAVSLRGTPTIEDRKMEFDAEELPDRDQDSEASRESNRGIKRKSDVSPSNGSNVKKFKKSMFNPFSWFFSRTNERSHSAPSSAAAAEYNINHDEGFSRPISAPELEPVSSSNESSDSDIDVEESASDKDSASSENDRQESNDTDVGAEEKDHNDTENHMVVDLQKVTVLPPQSTEDDILDNDPKDLSIIHLDFKSEKPNDKTQHELEGQVEEHSSHEKQPIQEDIGPDQIGQEQIDQEQIDQEQIDQEQIDQEQIDQEQIDSDFKQVEFENEHIDKGEHDFEQKQTVATEGNISTAEKGFVQNQTNNLAPKFQLASNADKEKEGVNPVEKDTTFLKATETNDEQLREIDDEKVENLPAEGITEKSHLRSNEATENEKSPHEDRAELQVDQTYEGNDDENHDHFSGPINSSQEVSQSSPVSVKANDEAAQVKGESGILNYLLELAKTKENDNEDEENADEKEDKYVSASKDTETSEIQIKTDFDTDDKNEENRSETESVNSEIAAALLRVANEVKERNEPLDFSEKDEIIKTEEQTDKVPEESTGTSEKYTDDEKTKNKPEESESAESGLVDKNDDGHFTALKAEDQIPDTPIKISDQEAQKKPQN